MTLAHRIPVAGAVLFVSEDLFERRVWVEVMQRNGERFVAGARICLTLAEADNLSAALLKSIEEASK